jgi:hypothetical protein
MLAFISGGAAIIGQMPAIFSLRTYKKQGLTANAFTRLESGEARR